MSDETFELSDYRILVNVAISRIPSLGWSDVVHGVIDTAKIREGFGSRRLRGFRELDGGSFGNVTPPWPSYAPACSRDMRYPVRKRSSVNGRNRIHARFEPAQPNVSPAAWYTLYTSSEGGIEWFTSRNIFFFFSTRRSCSLKILPPKQFRGSVFECGWRNKESCSRDSIDSKSVSVFLSRRSESNRVFPSATCCRNRERPLSRFPDND